MTNQIENEADEKPISIKGAYWTAAAFSMLGVLSILNGVPEVPRVTTIEQAMNAPWPYRLDAHTQFNTVGAYCQDNILDQQRRNPTRDGGSVIVRASDTAVLACTDDMIQGQRQKQWGAGACLIAIGGLFVLEAFRRRRKPNAPASPVVA